MSNDKHKTDILELLKSLPITAVAPGYFSDSRTDEIQYVGLYLYKPVEGVSYTTEDIYHYEKYGDPLPDGVYEWAVQQIQSNAWQ